MHTEPSEKGTSAQVMGRPLWHRIFTGVCVLGTLCILGVQVWDQVRLAQEIGNGLTSVTDAYSEANGLRGAHGHAEQGFSENWGLSNLAYGHFFPTIGRTHLLRYGRDDIYTSYPPGPEWLLALSMRVFGVDNIVAHRCVAIGINALILLACTVMFLMVLGAPRTLILIALLSWAPMFTNMMHYLHCWGYLMSLLLLELAMLVWFFHRGMMIRIGELMALALLGFVMGWMTIDYVFILTFTPLCVWLTHPRWYHWRMMLKALLFVGAMGLGFSAAYYIHFLQVIAHDGGLLNAVNDLGGSANVRLEGDPRTHGWNGMRFIYIRFFEINLGRPVYFRMRFIPLVKLAFAAQIARLVLAQIIVCFRRGIRWRFGSANVTALALSLGVSSIWIFMFRPHAIHNEAALGRHFFLFYFFAVYLLVNTMGLLRDDRHGNDAKSEEIGSDADGPGAPTEASTVDGSVGNAAPQAAQGLLGL